jgi:ElaB/YqjD/DUF883 family membrane-anchored ribosome-binding protein
MTTTTDSPAPGDNSTAAERAAHAALDGASRGAHAAVATARDAADGLIDAAGRSARHQWRAAGDRTRSATVATAGYIRERPLRALLVAAAIGAAATALIGVFGRRRPLPGSVD